MQSKYSPALIAYFWSKVVKTDACWLWTGYAQPNGYGRICQTRGKPSISVHRMAYELAYGPISPGMLICHRCDVKRCVRNDGENGHLFQGTPADNSRDMVVKGRSAAGDRNPARRHPERMPRGERHGSRTHPERLRRGDRHPLKIDPSRAARGERVGGARLTDEDIPVIRARLAAGEPHRKIAADFDVTKSSITRIALGQTWQHVA